MKRFSILAVALVAILGLTACSDDMTAPTTADADKAAMGRDMGRDMGRGAPAPGSDTIDMILANDDGDEDGASRFDLLLAAVGYIAENNPESPLLAGLLNNDQYTVFAPTDQAFIDLVTFLDENYDDFDASDPFASIDDLLGEGTLEAVVSYHVTEGRRAANSVVPPRGERRIETLLEGATFSVNTDGMITAVLNEAMIEEANLSARNGIVHVIDAVIIPLPELP
jgi:uncharacterized surface protein with fasciclin (FAS1) repeats